MVIDSIPDVTVSTIQTRNTDMMEMNDTTITSSTSSDQQGPTDMLHALHHDEKELRILAVVLSLTGGLVLSFLLGVGIFVYWHWRAWRARRRKKYLKSKKMQSSVKEAAIEIVSSAHPSMLSSPIPSPSSSSFSSSSLSSSSSSSSSSSLAIEAVNDSRVRTRQRDNTSVCSPRSPMVPPNPIASSSISSTSSSTSQRSPSSPTVATSSLVSTSPSITSTPIPSSISVHSGNNHTISNASDITKRDMMNDSAFYRPSPIMTNDKAGCSATSTSSTHHHVPPIIPPVLFGPTSSSAPIPTAPPAKECLDSPSPSSSDPLSPQDMSTGPSFDPPDIPPPAYSPN